MTRAVTLANLVAEDILTVDNVTDRVGIGTTTPSAQFQVGTGVSVYGNSGIVSATKFYGDGSNLSGITGGASLSAGSGAQRVVVTSLTSGAMTSAATDAELTYNSTTNTLSATTFSGNATGLTGTPNIGVGTITASGNVSVGGTLTYNDVTNIDSVGIITARSDVSIADKIIHTGDTNTAIRFPAADTFTVETNGVERLRVNNAGKIGLLDDDPNVPVNIKSAPITFAGIDIHLKLEDTTSMAADVGGMLAFEGLYTSGGAESVYAAVHGGKENASSGDYGGYFRILTRPNGGIPAERLRITSGGTAIFKGGLAEKYENAGTTLGSQPNNPLSDGNVILFTGNESGNKTINFTGVHATLSNGETVSFTAIITPNSSGVINVVQVDGQAITVKWSGGSVPSAGSSGQDIYQFQILKTGTGTSDYTVYGAATNYA